MIINTEWLQKVLMYVSLAVIGGALGHVMRTADGGRIRWGRVLLEAASAGFVGFLMLLMCNAYGLADEWTGLLVGVSGWLGANTSIGLLEKVVYNKLGLSNDADPK